MHIAIQLSGHLRDACNPAHQHYLRDAVSGCSKHATCDVFLFTYETLHPSSKESSEPCVAMLQRQLNLTDVMVEPNLVLPDVRAGVLQKNSAWFRTTAHVLSKRVPPLPSVGLRSYIYAAAMASAMRHGSGRHYAAAVRMRPDIYPQPGKEWAHMTGTAPSWGHLVQLLHNNDSVVASGVFSCKRVLQQPHEATVRLPGDKSHDNCFWAPPQTLDRVMGEWDAISPLFLAANACHRHNVVAFGSKPDGVSACNDSGVPGMWEACSPVPSIGCLQEDMLKVALNRTAVRAQNMPF